MVHEYRQKIWEKILVPTFIKLIREYSQIPFLAHLLCNQQQEKNIHLVLNINNTKKNHIVCKDKVLVFIQ